MNVLLFGAGIIGNRYYERIKASSELNVLAFVDNSDRLAGEHIGSVPIVAPGAIEKYAFEKVIITVSPDMKSSVEIFGQLKALGIPEEKIEYLDSYDFYPLDEDSDIRVKWLKDFAHYASISNIAGNVAECGVFRGYFARFINKYFSDRTLYLFDTFSGFDRGDIEVEIGCGDNRFNDGKFAVRKNIFDDTSVEMVMRRMVHPDKCVIRQGYFPNTAQGIDDTFAFVNLDMDLYLPMLEALRFFWYKMTVGGVILLHDYFHTELPGVARAVSAFEKEIHTEISKVTIGDFCSIALIKGVR